MNKNIEAINNKIDDIKSYRAEIIAKSNAEIKDAEEKVKNLEDELTGSIVYIDDIEVYKLKEQELKDARMFLGFLKSRRAKMNQSPLTDDEYRSMTADIREELEILQDKYTPEIQKKLFEVIALMDRYADEADELEEVLNKVYMLREGYTHGYTMGRPVRVACDIAKNHNDKNNVWGRFCSVYYSHWVNRND